MVHLAFCSVTKDEGLAKNMQLTPLIGRFTETPTVTPLYLLAPHKCLDTANFAKFSS